MAGTESQKQIVRLPNLPKSIQGDGRYLMSLLQESMQEIALQVNLANGFSAEEINPESGKYPTPRNFFLSFTRLGGTLSWSRIADESNLAYYEVRTDTNIGNAYGLLERTTANTSSKLPPDATGTVYLYAVSKDAEASNPSQLTYTKPRPDAPTDITLSVTNEGTLITFLEIPSDCVGATIYVDGVAYTSTDNIFLLKDAPTSVSVVEVAYFDQFGEGERGVLYITLPDITGFLVERNGSELDFYWDAVNIYGVSYVVKVGKTADWAKGLEIFTTKTNDKNRYIYPNTGECYLMVKAVDEHGNYSKNAAYYLISNDDDIHRNVILEFNQSDTLYSGNKINLHYDADVNGLTLERDAIYGEYIMDVKLPQKYKARNWMDFTPVLIGNSSVEWDEADFTWFDAGNLAWAGALGDLDNIGFKQQIAYHLDNDSTLLFNAQLNKSLLTDKKEEPVDKAHCDKFKPSHWSNGLYISPLTRLSYKLTNIVGKMNFSFCLKTEGELKDTIIAVIFDGHGNWLKIGYDARLRQFYCFANDGNNIYLDDISNKDRDWLTIAFSQGAEKRKLFLHSFSNGNMKKAEIGAAPIAFDAIGKTRWANATHPWKIMQVPWKMYSLTLCCYPPRTTIYCKGDDTQ
nr:MAG TPA: hypothetical protein [Caudoviricetes sp.]